MKIIALSLTAAALTLGAGIGSLVAAQPAPLLEGKDHPILLQRMVVTATPLPN